MYRDHATAIQAYAQSSATALEHVIQFVIITARVPLHRVPADLESARAGDQSVLFSWKGEAFNYAHLNRDEIYWHCMDILTGDDCKRDRADNMLSYLADLPGLGLAKGGFVAQLAFGLSGCMDTHNIKRFGLGARAVEYAARNRKRKACPKFRRRVVAWYNALVYRQGGTERLWDGWCEYVAREQSNIYVDAEHVSRLHCEALSL